MKDADGFFRGTTYDPKITPPETLLGQTVGTRLAHHHEIMACFKRWADESPRVDLKTYAKSYEGRELIRVVITSQENMAKLDEIKKDIAKLADPRGLDAKEAARIIAEIPVVGWIGYNIHGDEMSGADASLAVGYHLIAGTGPDVTDLLQDIVIILDPVMNPDGRERTISYIDQSAGFVPNYNYASMHKSRWPGGRGNHYLFDMNRDWIAGTC